MVSAAWVCLFLPLLSAALTFGFFVAGLYWIGSPRAREAVASVEPTPEPSNGQPSTAPAFAGLTR